MVEVDQDVEPTGPVFEVTVGHPDGSRTKVQVDAVLDDGRKINQVVARGNYGAEAARLWAALRTGINELARAYGLQPMAA